MTSWPEVLGMLGGEPVDELTGVFVDPRPDPGVRVRVDWAGWDRWSVFDDSDGDLTGGIHDSGRTVLIEAGVEVWSGPARLEGPQRLRGYLERPAVVDEVMGDITAVDEIDWSGRRCVRVAVDSAVGEAGVVIFDVRSGWQLQVAVGSDVRGFESVTINAGTRIDDLAPWPPPDADPRPGTAFVADDDGNRHFGCHIEVEAGPASVEDYGPSDVGIDEVLGWARDRADRVLVRWGTRLFSAGAEDLGYPPVPIAELRRPK